MELEQQLLMLLLLLLLELGRSFSRCRLASAALCCLSVYPANIFFKCSVCISERPKRKITALCIHHRPLAQLTTPPPLSDMSVGAATRHWRQQQHSQQWRANLRLTYATRSRKDGKSLGVGVRDTDRVGVGVGVGVGLDTRGVLVYVYVRLI